MNIVLLGHEDLASLTALDTLLRLCPGHVYTLFWSGEAASAPGCSPVLDALHAVDQRLYAQYLSRESTSPLFRTARTLSAPNSRDGLATLERLHPDLIVSVRYRRILKDEVIAIPSRGVLNLHSGILPDYRGVMATFWAMLAGEPEIGTTLHWITDAGIDTGPVVGMSRRPVDYRASYLENLLSLYPEGCAMIARAIAALAAGREVPARAQTPGEGHYFGPPAEADARNFIDKGLRLVPAD